MSKIISGPTYAWPSIDNPCHMACNGIIVVTYRDCPHGEVGDVWKPEAKNVSTVTEIDHENKVITFDSE